MTHANKAVRDVYRPTMRRELLKEGNKGEEIIMRKVDNAPAPPGPPRTPITVVSPAKWADAGNVYVVGETVLAETAGYTGGLTDTTTPTAGVPKPVLLLMAAGSMAAGPTTRSLARESAFR